MEFIAQIRQFIRFGLDEDMMKCLAKLSEMKKKNYEVLWSARRAKNLKLTSIVKNNIERCYSLEQALVEKNTTKILKNTGHWVYRADEIDKIKVLLLSDIERGKIQAEDNQPTIDP